MTSGPKLRNIVKASIVGVFAIAALTFFVLGPHKTVGASAMGPSPSFTGAPAENNCTVCHVTNPVNTGTGSIQILGVPANYAPGQEIEITVKAEKEDAVVYGFQLTAVDPNGGTPGTFSIQPESVPRMQIVPFTNDIFSRTYVQHTVDGLTGTQFGLNSWTFRWIAPTQAVGQVSFHAAANAADGDGSPSGDFIYTTSASTQPGAAVVSVGGQVFTYTGQGLRNAMVRLTGPDNNVKTVLTNQLGFYSFSNVSAGQSYTLTATSKRYRFLPKNISPSDNLTNIDFTGIE
jgi:hypothetical protein